jgi:probable phosphoglycerate mutase
MKTVIYLVRHGQSEGNLYDQFMGHTDTPLTDLGLRQAELAAVYMENIHL